MGRGDAGTAPTGENIVQFERLAWAANHSARPRRAEPALVERQLQGWSSVLTSCRAVTCDMLGLVPSVASSRLSSAVRPRG